MPALLLTGLVTAVPGEEGANYRRRGDVALCWTVNIGILLRFPVLLKVINLQHFNPHLVTCLSSITLLQQWLVSIQFVQVYLVYFKGFKFDTKKLR